ncbi:O-antigen ligase family protein [Nocardioides sp. TF02-7]|uniref:O-antigen ligase family protein n=1 Tax=Nocardioides sp. TF02-7 TaxID=2917724 RepID=UPI001F061BEF|nr:O-antigen ligase family protein [Nocardioides sp. TF02-7]UMG91348.1 O-antigen ligase family protein [Nocardioides sp. TF02-7]
MVWRRRRRAWLLALALPVGLVPAFMTLNRGMFIGLALAGTYIAVRQAARGNARALLGIAAVAVVAASIFTVLPTEELLAQRLEGSSTTEDRASLYRQSIDAVKDSPVLGYGAPQEPDHPGLPPVGTQGQLWMVLVSHGPLAALCFVGWMLSAWVRSVRRHELVPMVANAGLLVSMVQIFFYGLLPHGLPVIAVMVAIALRPSDRPPGPGQQSGSDGERAVDDDPARPAPREGEDVERAGPVGAVAHDPAALIADLDP